MFLRKTTRTNKHGDKVVYYQLAHNYRDPETGRTKPHILFNLGRADRHEREALLRLCRSIAKVCEAEVRDLRGDGAAPGAADLLPSGVTQGRTRPMGAVLVIEKLWDRLGIGPTLRALVRESGAEAPLERALLAMVANRLCEPQSKLGVWDRWLDDVHLPSAADLKLDHMYRAMDLLHQHADRVEREVFFHTADLLNLEVDLVFYDTTTASFAIDAPTDDDDPRRLGHSKEGTWTPQVVVALAVTRDGLPVRSWVLPGNTSDVATVQKVRADLRGWKLGRALFVADSGMNSAANRAELARACGKYVLACRVGSVAEIRDDVLTRAGRFKELADNLHVKEVVVGDGALRRRYILCRNPKQAKRERLHREQVLAELTEALASHKSRKASQKWAIDLMASGRYGRYLRIGARNAVHLDRKAVREAEKRDGKWVLITNDDTLGIEDAAQAYRGLAVIERCFRSLKTTQIRLTPMYHWLPRRITAHVKLCVLALLIERVASRESGQSWSQLRRLLDRLQVTQFTTQNGQFLRRNEPGEATRAALKKLEIPMPHVVIDGRAIAKNP